MKLFFCFVSPSRQENSCIKFIRTGLRRYHSLLEALRDERGSNLHSVALLSFEFWLRVIIAYLFLKAHFWSDQDTWFCCLFRLPKRTQKAQYCHIQFLLHLFTIRLCCTYDNNFTHMGNGCTVVT